MILTQDSIKKRDHRQAIQFAIIGMHFNWYLSNKLLLSLYGRYFWYQALERSTCVIAAYAGNELAGILLADIEGKAKACHSPWRALYVKIFEFLQQHLYPGSAGIYEQTNQELLTQYLQSQSPQGEIVFLAANPHLHIKGIGSILLQALESRENGKTVYLFTDNACTYQFYEHRGFTRACEKEIILELGDQKIPLQCLLYSKVLGE